LPRRTKAFWRLTGPGAVLVGLSIGAGELVIWPHIAAEHGSSMLWAAALGVFLQLWVNIEIGRYTVATGESAYIGLSRLWVLLGPLFIFMIVAQYLLPAWARSCGLAIKAIILGPDHPSPDWLWTGVAYAGVALVLFGPRRIYATVEKLIMVLVLFITLGLVYIAFRVGDLATLGDMLGGIVNFGYIEPGFPVRRLFGALVFAGAGGASNLFYAYYLQDKQIGMGARIPVLTNPFRGRPEAASQAGFDYPETEQNQRRFRDWLMFVKLDQTMYFWLLNTCTMFLFIFGALAVLRPAGIVPQSGRFLWDSAEILAGQTGPAGRYLFLLIGAATLFSTQLTIMDGLSRSIADLLRTNFSRAAKTPYATWYARVAISAIVLGVVLTAVMETLGATELGFVFSAAYMGGFMMAVYTPALLWMNLRHLPRSARPGPLNIVMMALAALVYVSFAVYSLAIELGLVSG
jgi:hypothetical protein